MDNISYWQQEKIATTNTNPKDECNILIIGAGISGIMTAFELSKYESDIIIVDKNKPLSSVTAKTTAKITYMHNLMYQDIAKIHGNSIAKKYLEEQIKAIDYILKTINENNIECNLIKLDNYQYATTESGYEKLLKEYDVLKKIGADISLVDKLEIDIPILKAILTKNQYVFHPIKYLNSIIKLLNKKSINILEGYNALDIQKNDDDYFVKFSNGKTIKAKKIVIATHYPFFNKGGLYFGKLYQEKNYLIAFETKNNINGAYINSDKPVRSLRYDINQNKTIGIMVGNSHIAGDKTDYNYNFKNLKNAVLDFDKKAKIISEWSNQDVMSIDYLPFIGQYSRCYPNIYLITGFHTWGMTNSHVAANIITKYISNQEINSNIFNPLRFSHLKSPKESLKLIGKAIDGLILSRFKKFETKLKNIEVNTGKIIKFNNKNYAVFNNNGENIILKPNCPHTGCFMQWNQKELTWDCKCHGSRFNIYGEVLLGPATKNLERISTEDII